jgi:hypothetical protein
MLRFCKICCTCLCLSAVSVGANAEDATVTLESTVVGNQEQPKVLYIVPWKSPGSSADLYRPVSSQLSAIFDHIERAELRRQIHYLDTIKENNEISVETDSE